MEEIKSNPEGKLITDYLKINLDLNSPTFGINPSANKRNEQLSFVNDISLNQSTSVGGTRSNSRGAGSSFTKNAPASHQRKQVLLQMMARPQSALLSSNNLTPALAYKNNAKYSGQIGYHQLRKNKTPNTAATSSVTGPRGSKSIMKSSNQKQTITPFNQSFDHTSPNKSFAQTKQQKHSNSQVNLNKQKRGSAYVPRDSRNISLLGPGTYEPKIEITKQRSPSALILGQEPHEHYEDVEGEMMLPYDINSFGKDAVKISIHPKLNQTIGNRNPGPGQYNPNYNVGRQASPEIKISPSRSNVSLLNDSRNLGPGSYDYSLKNIGQDCLTSTIQNSKKITFPETITVGIKTPGPGSYNPKVAATREKSPEYTMGAKPKKAHRKTMSGAHQPGPGFYPQKEFVGKEGPAFTFKPTWDPKPIQKLPGPGYYNPNDAAIKDKVKAFKISQSAKSAAKQQKSDIPYYNPEKSFGTQAPKYTISNTISKTRLARSPGPGEYEPQKAIQFTKFRQPECRISPSKASAAPKNQFAPGPGFYKNLDTFGKDAKKVSILGKSRTKTENQNPGPGYYQPNLTLIKETPPVHTASRSPQRSDLVSNDKKSNPGPGSYYSPEKFGKDAPQISIHSKLNELNQNRYPGPGTYNPTQTLIRERSPAYPIDTQSERLKSVSKERLESPGPGMYDARPTTFGQPPLYTIGQKHPSRNDNGVPGPGYYNPNETVIRGRPLGGAQSHTVREGVSGTEAPGPGIYDPLDQRYPNIAYTISPLDRQSPVSRDARTNPGAGYYNENPTFGREGIHYTIGSRSQTRNEDQVPGPGHYDANYNHVHARSPLSKILPSHYEPSGDRLIPGPGHYAPDDRFTRQRSPEYTIGGGQIARCISDDIARQPGPGHYDIQRGLIGGEHSLKYTIALKPHELASNNFPGPGQYNPNHNLTHENHPSAFTTREPRNGSVGQESSYNLGPGAYNPHDPRYQNISYTIPQGERMSPMGRDAKLNPGPGQYQSPEQFGKEGIHYTIGKRPMTRTHDQSPGPCHYDPISDVKFPRSPLGRIQPYHEAQGIKATPGPGYYEPSDTYTRNLSPSYKFGGGTERIRSLPRDLIDAPGPGHYDQRNLFGNGDSLKYTVGTKPREAADNNYPGPGYYNPDDHLGHPTSPKSTFPKTERGGSVPSEQRDRLGPGSYDLKDSRYPLISYKFNNCDRSDPMSRDARMNPGPGHYNQPELMGRDAPQYTIGEKSPSRVGEDYPGPGYYNPEVNITHLRSTLAKIFPYHDVKGITETPGPGFYDPKDRFTKQEGPHYTIGGNTERAGPVSHDQLTQPGPGHYDQRNLFGDGDSLKYTIGAKPHEAADNNYPGPGYYNPDDHLGHPTSPKSTFPKTERGLPVSQDQISMPGPGVYNPSDNRYKAVTYTISQAERPDPMSRDARLNPGPGTYMQPTLIGGQDAPHWTMGAKNNEFEGEQNPGPGHYNPEVDITHLRSTLAKIFPYHDVKGITETPGPGFYDPKDGITKQEGPHYTIGGNTERAEPVSHDQMTQPGPGHYDQRSLIGDGDSLKYTIGERHPLSDANFVPGPGHYEPNDNLTQDHHPSYSFPHGNKAGEVPSELSYAPGPGTYDPSDHKFPNINYKFSECDRPNTVSREARNNPGPGHYNQPDLLGQDGAPHYTMGSHHPSAHQDEFPGPGYYDPKDGITEPRSPLAKINPTHQYDQSIGYTPGPGHYDPDLSAIKERAPAPKMAKTKREFLTISASEAVLPGPGFYNAQLPCQSPSYTIGEKAHEGRDNNYPGPTSYTASHCQTEVRSPHYDFAKSPERPDTGLTRNAFSGDLGPGTYDANDFFLSGNNTSISYSIPKGEHEPSGSENPGPGAYRIPVKFGQQKLFAIPIQNEEYKWV